MKDLLGSLAFGTNLSSVLIVAATFLILWLLQLDNWIWISCAVVVGLVVGIIIGRSTEYYTSQSYRPTQKLSESGKTGPATVIISGIGLGMLSTAIPVVAVVIGIIASYFVGKAWLDQFAEQIYLNPLLFIGTALFVLLLIVVCVVLKAWLIATENPVNSIKSE